MKKLLLMTVLLVASILLVACGDPYDIENLKDRNIVEMSAEDVETLLTAVDWDQAGEATSFTMNADVNVQLHQAISFGGTSYETDIEINALFNSLTYMVDSDDIDEASVHSESEIEFLVSQSFGAGQDVETQEASGNGTLNAYLYEGYAYVNPEISMTSGGTETSISGREKMNDPISQEDWDELRSEADVDSIIDGGLSEVYSAPEAIEELLDWDNVSEFMEVFPIITVYQNGSVTTVHFEVNKALILEHAEDLLEFVNDKVAETGGEVATDAELADAISEIEDYMDYFESLSMTMDIVLDDGELVRYGLSMDIESNDNLFDDQGMSIDISFSVISDFGVDIPDFPSDLDEYTGVDEIGNNWDLGGILD